MTWCKAYSIFLGVIYYSFRILWTFTKFFMGLSLAAIWVVGASALFTAWWGM